MQSTNGTSYLALRPILDDFVLSMPRGAQVIYPKDAARIVGLANLGPGSPGGRGRCRLRRPRPARCSAPSATRARCFSYERRQDFADIARGNVERWFGGVPASWTLTVGDLVESLDERDLDALVLDMLAPWECIDAAADALAPGGVLVAYVATTTQMSRVVETLRVNGGWTEPRAEESLLRTWHLEGLAVRPDHHMNGHTGFLVTVRRLAPGAVLPPEAPSTGSRRLRRRLHRPRIAVGTRGGAEPGDLDPVSTHDLRVARVTVTMDDHEASRHREEP